MSSQARNPLLVAGRRPPPAREMRQKAKTNSLLLRESFFSLRGVQDRPVSVATEFLESDYEEEAGSDLEAAAAAAAAAAAHDNDFGEHDEHNDHDAHDDSDEFDEHDYYTYANYVRRSSHGQAAHAGGAGDSSPRRSLDSGQPSFTTVSSYDEVPTPRSGRIPAGVLSAAGEGSSGSKHAVEGPRGPHLFRISTLSAEFADALTLSPLTPHPGTPGFPGTPSQQQQQQPSPVLPHGVTPLPPTPRGRGRAGPSRGDGDDADANAPFRFVAEADEAAGALDPARLASWSPECVAQWMLQAGLELGVCERFVENDITGGILITLKFEDLKELGIQSFGLRTVVWDQIGVLKSGRTRAAAAAAAASAKPSAAAAAAASPVEPDTDIDEEPDRSVRHELRTILRGETSRSPPLVRDPRAEQQQLSASSVAREQRRQEKQQQQPLRRRASSRRKKPAGRMDDVITPLESVSIVGIEQVLPRPHQCSKGENCSKFRRYQRMLEAIRQEHPNADACGGPGGIRGGARDNGPGGGPGGGPGVLVIAGDLGSLRNSSSNQSASDDVFRPVSDAIPSVVASSDVLGPGFVPPPAAAPLHADTLRTVQARDPQDNVRQFLAFQQAAGGAEVPPTPPFELYPSSGPATPTQQHYAPAAHERLRALPRLAIPAAAAASQQLQQQQQQQQQPRSAVTASAAPTSSTSYTHTAIEESPDRDDRGGQTPTGLGSAGAAGAGAGMLYRFGTPFTDADVPVTSFPTGPIAREVSQSVPPDMSYRTGGGSSSSFNTFGSASNAAPPPPMRTMSRASARRPSFPLLPALAENPAPQPMQPYAAVHQRAASAIGYRLPTTAQGTGAAPVARPLQPPPRVRYPWSLDRVAFERAVAPQSLSTAATGPVKTTTVTAAVPAAAASASSASLSSAASTLAPPSSSASMRSAASTAPTSAAGSLFGSGGAIAYQGAVKKRRTKMLRHEWHDRYVTLRGTRMAVHKDAASAHDRTLEYIDIDDYAIACSASAASSRKLSAAFKAMHLRQGSSFGASAAASGPAGTGDKADVAAFAFQLIPQDHRGGMRLRKRDSALPAGGSAAASSSAASVRTADSAASVPPPPPPDAVNGTGKTHHFAVKSRDDQLEWVRELMLAKAMRQKGEGFEVSVNGNMI